MTLEQLKKKMDEAHYIYDDTLATVLYVALQLGRPLLIEGAAGVGKTEISKALDMSTKVINNILSVNNGENFKFISFQSVNHDSTDDQADEDYVEQKLVNE